MLPGFSVLKPPSWLSDVWDPNPEIPGSSQKGSTRFTVGVPISKTFRAQLLERSKSKDKHEYVSLCHDTTEIILK